MAPQEVLKSCHCVSAPQTAASLRWATLLLRLDLRMQERAGHSCPVSRRSCALTLSSSIWQRPGFSWTCDHLMQTGVNYRNEASLSQAPGKVRSSLVYRQDTSWAWQSIESFSSHKTAIVAGCLSTAIEPHICCAIWVSAIGWHFILGSFSS